MEPEATAAGRDPGLARRGDPARRGAAVRHAVPPPRARRGARLSRRRRPGRARRARAGRRAPRRCSTSPISASSCCSSWSGSSSIRAGCGGCKHDIFGLGLLQVTVAGLALTALVHVATGFSWPASLAIGLPLALSSTAQVLPSLRVDRRDQHHAGRARLLDPAVPGPVDRAVDHDHRRLVARAGRSGGAAGLAARPLHRRSRSSGWCWPAAS